MRRIRTPDTSNSPQATTHPIGRSVNELDAGVVTAHRQRGAAGCKGQRAHRQRVARSNFAHGVAEFLKQLRGRSASGEAAVGALHFVSCGAGQADAKAPALLLGSSC